MATTARPRPTVMTLTPAAVARVNSIMANNPEHHALRIGVKKGGCAGMEYTMEWVDEPGKFDEVVEQDGARVLIDPAAVLFLFGTEMDYRVEKLSAEFVFNNPNQTSACGCGESVELRPVDKAKLEALNA
jgi:iron-sulfur cluster assembly protein